MSIFVISTLPAEAIVQSSARVSADSMMAKFVAQYIVLCGWLLKGRDKMGNISATTFSNTFSWMKMFEFWLKFHWSLFPRV